MKKNYIQESASRAQRESKEQYLYSVPVYLLQELPENIDIKKVLKTIESAIPQVFFQGVEVIYVGHIKEFEDRGINALYRDGAIYVTSTQSSDEDMIDDIIHETAHSVEEVFYNELYADEKIEDEFLGKRSTFYETLKAHKYPVSKADCFNPEYVEDFDMYLNEYLGYDLVATLTMGLFLSPYAVTSLKEYFANSFETYFLGERRYLQEINPQVFIKIENLVNIGENYV